LSIDPQSGLISGTIAAGAANAGPYETIVTATDGTSTDAQTLIWNVGTPGSVQISNTYWPLFKFPLWASGVEGTSLFFSNQNSFDVPAGGQVLPLAGMAGPSMGSSNQQGVPTTLVVGEQIVASPFSFQANSGRSPVSGVANATDNITFDPLSGEADVLTQLTYLAGTDNAGQVQVNGASNNSQNNSPAMQSSQLVLLPYVPRKFDGILGEGEFLLPASHQKFLSDVKGLQELLDFPGDRITALD